MKLPDGVKITPMLRQYAEWKDKYPDCILFFRMGDFFEMFFDDAETASNILGITLTARDQERAIPMAGVPYHAVDSYLEKLIRAGYRVAVCDQTSEPDGRSIVDRRVVRVVTPGTFTPQDSQDDGRLAAVCVDKDVMSVALLHPAVGRLSAGTFSTVEAARIVSAFYPSEIVIPRGQEDAVRHALHELSTFLSSRDSVTARERQEFSSSLGSKWLCARWGIASLSSMGIDDGDPAAGCAAAALRYLEETQFSKGVHVTSVEPIDVSGVMSLDRTTITSLELADDGDLSLFSILDRCRTPQGRRLLKEWLVRPSSDIKEIGFRADCVEYFRASPNILKELSEILHTCGDIGRAVGRICLGTGNPRDMASVMTALRSLPSIKDLIQKSGSGRLISITSGMPDVDALRIMLERGIVDSPPRLLAAGGVIRDGYDAELDELRDVIQHSEERIRAFEQEERERTGIKIRVGINKVFGYYIEVGKSNLDKVPDDYVRRQTVSGGERYINERLRAIERTVQRAESGIQEREEALYRDLVDAVEHQCADCRQISDAIALLDVLRSFAEVAADMSYTRPIVDESRIFDIRGARHPVVEKALRGAAYTPNDILLDPDGKDGRGSVAVITGPNMAGKSTYLRSAALLAVMAHIGSFVPAEYARIGVLDRIFTRVGARDELVRGKSTFMVEMTETANILRNASARSLIVLDEVGRGTSTYDGMSIAWAVVEFLSLHIEGHTKALFATHYHELTALDLPLVFNLSMAVEERGDDIYFLHEVRDGPASRSYGVDVARLAGVPNLAVKRAKEILTVLERDRSTADLKDASARYAQREIFFDVDREGVIERLSLCDPDTMTPMEALGLVAELSAKSRKILGLTDNRRRGR